MDSDTRDRILTEANNWLGTPWMHQARVPGVGVDCIMLICEVYERAGVIDHIDPRPYPRDWHMHRSEERIIQGALQHAEEIDFPQPGDIAVFQFGRCFSHAAIVIDWPEVIHSYIGQGVRPADSTTGVLANRDVKFFRIKQ